MPKSPLGSLLRLSRQKSQLTQSEAAYRAGLSQRHLSFLETGRARPSRGAIERFVSVFQLNAAHADQLRLAAGFAPSSISVIERGVATDLFTLAVDFDNNDTDLTGMIRHARNVLANLGVQQYFFGRVHRDRRGKRSLCWYNPATFPTGWLERYDLQGYAAADPLLAMAERNDLSFLWADALETCRPCNVARRMFEEAATAGITGGAVVPLHRAGGVTDFVSYMGDLPNRDRSLLRVGLQTIGLQMLDRFGGEQEYFRPTAALPAR